ncbi:MAG: SNF2-related protein, partial [Candidatus Bathyarchaeia archaeon]
MPQPSFGSLTEITPFKDGFFHHPLTLNPKVAKETYRQAGLRLKYSPRALKLIREHRAVLFEYDKDGIVWVKPVKGDSLREILDDRTFKTYAIWSPYYDAYRLRQAGSVRFAKRAFEEDDVRVELKNFPESEVQLQAIRAPRKVNVTLYPFQRKAVDFILRNDGRTCLFDEMGLGKTITATTALLGLVRERKASRAIIVAPNAVVEQWRGELVEKFNLEPTLVSSKRTLNERMMLYD